MNGLQDIDPLMLTSFGADLKVAVIGASGGLGGAFVDSLESCPTVEKIFRLSRSNKQTKDKNNAKLHWLHLDLEDEQSIADAAATIRKLVGELHLVILATGILHDGDRLQPEKSWNDINRSSMAAVFQLNTIGPALVGKHFLPLLAKNKKTVFAALSARVGSIDDNQLGGWHSYRASKAALNMLLKNFAIELKRRNPQALCLGIHPGTVDTALSKPFQANVQKDRLFSTKFSVRSLLNVIDNVSPHDSGATFAWDGTPIPF